MDRDTIKKELKALEKIQEEAVARYNELPNEIVERRGAIAVLQKLLKTEHK